MVVMRRENLPFILHGSFEFGVRQNLMMLKLVSDFTAAILGNNNMIGSLLHDKFENNAGGNCYVPVSDACELYIHMLLTRYLQIEDSKR